MNSTYTYEIFHEGVLTKTLKNEINDLNVIGEMQRLQPHSTCHAIKYEGWKIICTDEQTGEKFISRPTTNFYEFVPYGKTIKVP